MDMHGILKSDFGMPDKVVEDIINRYSEDAITQYIEYAKFASENGLIRKTVAAYFVAAISGRWKPPKGYKHQAWYSVEEAELIMR